MLHVVSLVRRRSQQVGQQMTVLGTCDSTYHHHLSTVCGHVHMHHSFMYTYGTHTLLYTRTPLFLTHTLLQYTRTHSHTTHIYILYTHDYLYIEYIQRDRERAGVCVLL